MTDRWCNTLWFLSCAAIKFLRFAHFRIFFSSCWIIISSREWRGGLKPAERPRYILVPNSNLLSSKHWFRIENLFIFFLSHNSQTKQVSFIITAAVAASAVSTIIVIIQIWQDLIHFIRLICFCITHKGRNIACTEKF